MGRYWEVGSCAFVFDFIIFRARHKFSSEFLLAILRHDEENSCWPHIVRRGFAVYCVR